MKEYLNKILLTGIFLIPFFPQFGEIDRIASQGVILNIFSLLSILYLTNYQSKFDFKIFSRNRLDLFFLFLIFSLLSFFNSLNIVESTIEIFRFISVFVAFTISILLFSSIQNKKGFIQTIILVSLFFEITGVLFQVINNLYPSGFTGNKNIQSVSIILKSTFLLPLFLSEKFINNALASVILFFAFISVYSIGAKAGIVEIFFFSIILPIIFLFKKLEYKSYLIKAKTFFPLVIFLVSSIIYSSKNSAIIDNVSATINYSSEAGSVNRLRYYSRALESISENPFLGIGIGNWKIIATKLDSTTMKNYVVQYYTHNDFLQYFAETGIIGGLCYALFLFLLAFNFLKRFIKARGISQSLNYSIILLAISIYIIDANLNFPATRVIMQLNLLFIILYNEYSCYEENEK